MDDFDDIDLPWEDMPSGADIGPLQRTLRDQTELEYVAFEVARNKVGPNLPAEDLLPALGMDEEAFVALSQNKAFVQLVRGFVKKLTEEGTGFRLKTQVAVEASIPTLYEIANDPRQAAGMRLKAIDQMADYAGYKYTKENDHNHPSVPQFQINFNLPEGYALPAPKIVQAESDE